MMSLALIILESLYLWPLAAGVGVLLTVGLMWLYPPQIRGSGWGGRLTLGLRWAAMAALTVALLKPVALRTGAAGEGGGVDVLVDCSKSMGVVDAARTPAQRVSLAAALGRLPEGARSEVPPTVAAHVARLESLWRKLSAAQSDLDFARVTGRSVAERQGALRAAADEYTAEARRLSAMSNSVPVGMKLRAQLEQLGALADVEPRRWGERAAIVRTLRDLSQDFQAAEDARLYESDPVVRAACDEAARLSRLDLAEAALSRPNGLADQLGARGPVTVYALGAELRRVSAAAGAAGADGLHLNAEGRGSDLTAAVGAAVAGAAGRPVRAVVLISDGRQVGGRADLTSPIRPSGVPVYTVGVAAPALMDAWISRVSMPPEAFAGETIEGEVEVRCVGVAEAPRQITITAASGRQTLRLQPRASPDGKPSATDYLARFALPIDPPGGAAAERVTFAIDHVPGEASAENDRVERWLKVSSATPRVAAFTAAPSWDFQYLQASLERRRWLQLDARVLDPTRPRLPLTPQQIRANDVVILHDVPVDALDVNQWDAVSRMVNDGGGSLIVIAGTQTSVADWSRRPAAAALLPFHDVRPTWKQWPGELPAFRFAPSLLGDRLGMRPFDGAESARHWAELPGVYRFLQIPDKNLYGNVSKLLVETEGGTAVVTERPINLGHAYFVGIDETWRWRTRSGERESERFWRQLVRQAAGEPYAASRGGVALDVDRVACEPTDTVKVKARVRGLPDAARGAAPKGLTLAVRRDGSTVRTIELEPAPGGRFVGTVLPLPQGDYVLQVVGGPRRGRGAAAGADSAGVSVPLHVAASDESEMRDLSGDPHLLERLAKSAGGEYLPIDNVGRLPDALAALHDADSRLVRKPLYSSPLLYGFVLACLSGEWAMRKRLGLA